MPRTCPICHGGGDIQLRTYSRFAEDPEATLRGALLECEACGGSGTKGGDMATTGDVLKFAEAVREYRSARNYNSRYNSDQSPRVFDAARAVLAAYAPIEADVGEGVPPHVKSDLVVLSRLLENAIVASVRSACEIVLGAVRVEAVESILPEEEAA